MLKLRPFTALRYNPKQVSMGDVLAPPYDIISEDEQQALYNQDPNNVIRLILGQKHEADTATDNCYTRAKEHLTEWLASEHLIKDQDPSFYIYEHQYAFHGQIHTLVGIISLMALAAYDEGTILPHENTLSGPLTDRFQLMDQCSCHFSQIFTVFHDEKKGFYGLLEQTLATDPLYNISIDSDNAYRLWKISDAGICAEIERYMSDQTLMIADGHHRYQTSLNFSAHLHEKHSDLPEVSQANYTMIYACPFDAKGLHLLPTHRACFNLSDVDPDHIISECSAYFECTPYEDQQQFQADIDAFGKTGKCLGLVFPEHRYYLLKLSSHEAIASFFDDAQSDCLKQLDVSILHSVILEGILGLSKESILRKENLTYIKDAGDVFDKVSQKTCDIGFILNPTTMEEMKKISILGEKMPQKSTYFLPKLITGLVMNPIEPKKSVVSYSSEYIST